METGYFISSIIQTSISLFVGVLAVFLTFYLFRKVFTRRYDIGIDNVAFSILLGAIVISVSYLMSGLDKPIGSVLRILKNTVTEDQFIWAAIKYCVLFVFIGLLIALIINVVGLILFVKLTRGINEFKEISEDNIAVGIITGCIIISLTFFVRHGAIEIVESLIPYPEIGSIGM